MDKLNPHSRLASFYRHFYLTPELPNNLCNYFWGLMIAFICCPFVWMAMAINRYKKIVFFRTDMMPVYKYDEHGNHQGTTGEYKEFNRYDVSYNKLSTGMGIVFTLLTFIIGLVVVCLFKGIGVDLSTMFKELPNGYIGALLMYFFGILGYILVIVFIGVVLLALKAMDYIKYEPTQEEKDLKRQLDIERERKKSDKLLAREREREANPSIFRLAWRRLIAFKQNNCPMINWDYDRKKD